MRTIDHYKAMVCSLGYGCPYGEESKDCPLSAFRKLSARERFVRVLKMNRYELQKIYDYHRECLAKKEGRIKQDIGTGEEEGKCSRGD